MIHARIRDRLIQAPIVDVGEWQARVGAPEGQTIEIEDVSFEFPIPKTPDELADIVEPNLPWAEDHFLERVSGKPWNPPPSNAWWPYNVRGNSDHMSSEKFSHTYPERMWPKKANPESRAYTAHGIRYAYGDLSDLVRLFDTRPDTRQGYLPIWFPEDTGAHHGERVPCTLGYHMMQRHGKLSIRYYLRSCDFVRHFRDDVYMACRLAQWVTEQVLHFWDPGVCVMHVSSMHAFHTDRAKLRQDDNEFNSARILKSLS
jgi:hypothetical protein